ncbi:MAG: (deoxy)nucleoside triphosphate pyrophosphohydrolase [Pseudomonadota bacterium]
MTISYSSPSSRPLLLVVAAAMFDAEGRVLIAQRPANKMLGGLWEFPGGKLEPGESPEAALVRELKEELDVMVEPDCLDPYAFASHSYTEFHLLMPLYAVRAWEGQPIAREAQALAWAVPHELRSYKMPPADGPLVEQIIARTGG